MGASAWLTTSLVFLSHFGRERAGKEREGSESVARPQIFVSLEEHEEEKEGEEGRPIDQPRKSIMCWCWLVLKTDESL